MVIETFIVVGLVVGGIYVFVPQARKGIASAWTTIRDDLGKMVTDGEALVKRLENHAASQADAAAVHTAAAAASTKAADVATAVAAKAAATAEAVKSALSTAK